MNKFMESGTIEYIVNSILTLNQVTILKVMCILFIFVAGMYDLHELYICIKISKVSRNRKEKCAFLDDEYSEDGVRKKICIHPKMSDDFKDNYYSCLENCEKKRKQRDGTSINKLIAMTEDAYILKSLVAFLASILLILLDFFS